MVAGGCVWPGVVPGGVVGFVGVVPGGAVGLDGVAPGIGSCPGGRVGSPGGGLGRGVDAGTCASAALVPANKILDRITALTKVRDIRVSIRRKAP